jgi:hypothetical protein
VETSSKPRPVAPAKPRTAGRQFVGFSLPPAVAAEVQIEAARRNLALKDLFGETWAFYKNNTKRSA